MDKPVVCIRTYDEYFFATRHGFGLELDWRYCPISMVEGYIIEFLY